MCGYLFIIYHLSISIMYQCIYLYIYLYIYHVSIMYLSTYHLPIIYRLIDHLSIYQSSITYLSIYHLPIFIYPIDLSPFCVSIYIYPSIHPSIYPLTTYLPMKKGNEGVIEDSPALSHPSKTQIPWDWKYLRRKRNLFHHWSCWDRLKQKTDFRDGKGSLAASFVSLEVIVIF